MTTSFTISKLKQLFWRYGLVDTLVSDNGTQFVSREFTEFLKVNNINHILTAPGHPATNGQAENFVKTLKKSLYATVKANQSTDFDVILNQFLFDYRNSTHCVTNESPAKLFLGRNLNSRLSRLKPPLTTEKILAHQDKSISNFHGKRDEVFLKGDKVYIRDYSNPNRPKWSEGVVKERNGPRSYQCIFSHSNREIKRHLNQIRGQHNETLKETNETSDASDLVVEKELPTQEVENVELVTQSTPEIQVNNPVIVESTSVGRTLRPRKDGKVINH